VSGQTFASLCLPEAIRISGEHKRLAEACGVHWRTAYKWGAGEAPIPPDREEHLAAELVAASPGVEVSGVMHSTAAFLEGAAKALADGKITVAEAADVRDIVQRCIFALECAARAIERRAER
jgi:hypothetical protein